MQTMFSIPTRYLTYRKQVLLKILQGVRLRLFIFRYFLQSTMLPQMWQGGAYLRANICPFVILEYFFQKVFQKRKILHLQNYAPFCILWVNDFGKTLLNDNFSH